VVAARAETAHRGKGTRQSWTTLVAHRFQRCGNSECIYFPDATRPVVYSDILVPTDGSEPSRNAARHAIDLADRYDATLHTLYVVEATALTPDLNTAALYEELEAIGRRAIDDVVEAAERAGVEPVREEVASGQASSAIVDYVADQDVDLVVLGSHGRSGLERYLIGSVAEKVIRRSPVPVLTVPRDR
jgi:nucleotide-binding universal stress UspA family protein